MMSDLEEKKVKQEAAMREPTKRWFSFFTLGSFHSANRPFAHVNGAQRDGLGSKSILTGSIIELGYVHTSVWAEVIGVK
jgi:hypothetical protein